MSDEDSEGGYTPGELIAPPPRKERLKPLMGLREMTIYVMELREKALFKGPQYRGQPADHAFVHLTPEDVEALDDIAATLDYFYLERQRHRGGR